MTNQPAGEQADARVAVLEAAIASTITVLEQVNPDPLFDSMLVVLRDALGPPAAAPGAFPGGPVRGVDDTAGDPALEAVADSLDAVPSAGLRADMRRIATGYRGVAYDPHDRPAEVLAVRRAALEAGLIPVPDESLLRTYRGTTPPVPAADAAQLEQQAIARLRAAGRPLLADLAEAARVLPEPVRELRPTDPVTVPNIAELPGPVREAVAVTLAEIAPALAGLYGAGHRAGLVEAARTDAALSEITTRHTYPDEDGR